MQRPVINHGRDMITNLGMIVSCQNTVGQTALVIGKKVESVTHQPGQEKVLMNILLWTIKGRYKLKVTMTARLLQKKIHAF